jgi:hypothetical protein
MMLDVCSQEFERQEEAEEDRRQAEEKRQQPECLKDF